MNNLERVVKPPNGQPSWSDAAASMPRLAWSSYVASLASDYVAHLRNGVSCGCGAVLHQPLQLGGAASKGLSTITETIDLTLDSDDDNAAAIGPPSGVVLTKALKLECGYCSAAYCAACGLCVTPGKTDAQKSAAPAGKRQRVASPANAETVVLLDDDDEPVAAGAPATELSSTAAAAPASVALPSPASGKAAEDHVSHCTLRYVHAISLCVERIRRVHLDIDPAISAAGDKIAAATPSGALAAGAAAGAGSSMSNAYAVVAGLMAASGGIPSYLPYPGMETGEFEDDEYYGEDDDECDCGMHHGHGHPAKVPAAKPVSAAAAAASAAKPLTVQQLQAIASGKDVMSAYNPYGHGSSSSAAGGTGYAGGANDTSRLRAAEMLRKIRTEARDGVLGPIIQSLNDALPRDIFGVLGWEPIDTVLVDSSSTSSSASSSSSSLSTGAAAAAAASTSSSASAVVEIDSGFTALPRIVRGVATDCASDHPLLLHMLLGPGFGDGKPFSAFKTTLPSGPPQPQEIIEVDDSAAPAPLSSSRSVISISSTEDAAPTSKPAAVKKGRGGAAAAAKAAPAATGRGSRPKKGAAAAAAAAPAAASSASSAAAPAPSAAAAVVGSPAAAGKRKRGAITKASIAPSAAASSSASSSSSSTSVAADAAADAASNKKFGEGDGLCGPSVWYSLYSDLLRTSVMDMGIATEGHRSLFFSLLKTVEALSSHPDVAAALLFTPRDDVKKPPDDVKKPPASSSSSSAFSFGKAGAAAALKQSPVYAPWVFPSDVFVGKNNATVLPPHAALAGIVADLQKQARIYLKNSTSSGGGRAPEILIGDSADSDEFTAVLCLSRDVEVAAERADAGVKRWGVRHAALLREMDDCAAALVKLDPDNGDDAVEDSEGDAAAAGSSSSGGAGGLKRGARGASAARAAATASVAVAAAVTHAAASASSAISTIAARLGSASYGITSAIASSTAAGVADPTLQSGAGMRKIGFSVPDMTAREYEHFLREQAYDTMDGLIGQHVLARAAGVGKGGWAASSSGGAASMTRLMRVSAEMSNLPTLACHWASSILVRQDESSMDVMRAAMTGPADTPYMNGFFQFDILLPKTYPSEPPSVKFLTTGGGTVRFNPNLYAEGKVCLSLLGTWSGPGWVSGVSTLSQVLLSIQGQIMVDQPYANEPGYEKQLGTPTGIRAVAKHNTLLRLATIRHAMLEVLRKPPAGLELPAKAHFYFKVDELRAQFGLWVADAIAMAKYELTLTTATEAAKRAYEAAAVAEAGSHIAACGAVKRAADVAAAEKARADAVAKAAADAAAAAAAATAAAAAAAAGVSDSPGSKKAKKAKPISGAKAAAAAAAASSYYGGGYAGYPGGGYPGAYSAYTVLYASTASNGLSAPTQYPLTVYPYSAKTKALFASYAALYVQLAKWRAETSVPGHQPFGSLRGVPSISASGAPSSSSALPSAYGGSASSSAFLPSSSYASALTASSAPAGSLLTATRAALSDLYTLSSVQAIESQNTAITNSAAAQALMPSAPGLYVPPYNFAAGMIPANPDICKCAEVALCMAEAADSVLEEIGRLPRPVLPTVEEL